MYKFYLAILAYFFIYSDSLYAQEGEKTNNDNKEVKTTKYKKQTYIGFGLPFYADSGPYKKFQNKKYGGIISAEIQFHPYISFTDNTQLLAMSRGNDKTAFVFAYYLGFRFYLGTPFVFFEQRMGLVDHMKYWEGEYYFEGALASLIGFSYPVTPKIKLETSVEVQYIFYNNYKGNKSSNSAPSKLSLGTHLGVTFLI